MLLTGKNWRLSASQKVADADTLLNVLLKNRGITEGQSVEQFLSEDDGIWHDPFLYNDMRKAVDIINETIDSHGKVLVYGDYDCDGVTATSILVRYFRSHSVDVTDYEIMSLVIALISLLFGVFALLLKLFAFLDSRYKRK